MPQRQWRHPASLQICRPIDMTAHQESRLRNPARSPFFSAKLMEHWQPSHPTRVELESSADHNNGAGIISGFKAHVSQCFCASYEEATAETALISNDPIPATILTNHED
jgi:hypothetical protein